MLYLILAFAVVVISIWIILKIYSRLSIGRCTSPVCLIGKTALVTGGNSDSVIRSKERIGITEESTSYLVRNLNRKDDTFTKLIRIGFQTALALASRGCRVIIADKDNCEKSKERIIKETGNSNIVIKYFDLASLASVRKLAQNVIENEDRLDILINNAGTCGLGNFYSEDELHVGMQVNHFGPFLLTHLLVGLLKQSAPSRIIFVSSCAAYVGAVSLNQLNSSGVQFLIYANSKLCNVITANEFSRKLKGTGVTSNSLHPGLVYTPIYRKYAYGHGKYEWLKRLTYFLYLVFLKPFCKNVEEGAQTSIYLATTKEVENVSGKFFVDCKSFLLPYFATKQRYAQEIWEISEKLVKLSSEEKL